MVSVRMPTPRAPSTLAVTLLVTAALSASCRATIDDFTAAKVVPHAARVPDVGQACGLGTALRSVLTAPLDVDSPPSVALVVAETTSAMCAEREAWEAQLSAVRAKRHVADERGRARWRDARILEARLRAATAERYYRAFQHLELAFGTVGDGCPELSDENEEFVYLLGLFAGTAGAVHGKASGGRADVPSDVIARVARGCDCLSGERWWGFPPALQSAAWATLPGSGPPDVDAWARLNDFARASDKTGVRLARALGAMISANAAREEDLRRHLVGHADALIRFPVDKRWALLDAYATSVSLHESDVLWSESTGHRTDRLGELPPEPVADSASVGEPAEVAPAALDDPFADETTEEPTP